MRAQNKFEKFLMNDEWVESHAPLIRGLCDFTEFSKSPCLKNFSEEPAE